MISKEQIRKYHEKVDNNIKEHGYHITYVTATDTPAFCYSTGIYRTFGIPEIFISSLPQNLSGELANQYVAKFQHAAAIPLQQKIDNLSARFPIYLIEVPTENLKDYALSSVRVYGQGAYRYVQLIYPDTQGYFPHESGYDYDQEILGNFAP